jgi:hypothetical protein
MAADPQLLSQIRRPGGQKTGAISAESPAISGSRLRLIAIMPAHQRQIGILADPRCIRGQPGAWTTGITGAAS